MKLTGPAGFGMRYECVHKCVFMCAHFLAAPPAYHALFVSIETRVQIQESVRGKDVFVIQTVSK